VASRNAQRTRRLVVGCRRRLVFLSASNGRSAYICVRRRGRRRSRWSGWTASRRRLSTAASRLRAATRGPCPAATTTASRTGPGRKRDRRRRCGRFTWRASNGPTGRCGGGCDCRWNDWCDRRRASRRAAWLLFVTGRLLLSISLRTVRSCRPSQLQLNRISRPETCLS
jgi:hypothetical protein